MIYNEIQGGQKRVPEGEPEDPYGGGQKRGTCFVDTLILLFLVGDSVIILLVFFYFL